MAFNLGSFFDLSDDLQEIFNEMGLTADDKGDKLDKIVMKTKILARRGSPLLKMRNILMGGGNRVPFPYSHECYCPAL